MPCWSKNAQARLWIYSCRGLAKDELEQNEHEVDCDQRHLHDYADGIEQRYEAILDGLVRRLEAGSVPPD